MTQKEALDILKLGHNIYLTGAAGSGKTFVLNQYINYLREKKVEVGITASTGIAATHLGGMTIHSWSGMGIRDELTQQDAEMFLKKRPLVKRFSKTEVLVIDEVSMLHDFQLDLVNQICQMFKKSCQPFGGIQVVLCGDFFQLPPIGKWGRSVNLINRSEIWQKMDLKVCYLNEQHRQSGDELTNVLNDIRTNNVGEHTLQPLRKRYQKEIDNAVSPTKLYTHNVDVDAINQRELSNIPEKVFCYTMRGTGNKTVIEFLKHSCLAPEELELKKSAKVMFVKNDPGGEYVNGTLGTVVGFTDDGFPVVETLQGENIIALRESWSIEEDGKVRAEVYQIPLRLAWAITVHKSQGMTLDAAEMDLSKSFVPGMGYVALSRVRALKGLKLMGLNQTALQINKEVLQLDEELKKMSFNAMTELQKVSNQHKKVQQEIFTKQRVTQKQDEISTYEKTKLLVLEKLSLDEIAKQRCMSKDTIIKHLEKLISNGSDIDISYLMPPKERLEEIQAVLAECIDEKLKSIYEFLEGKYSYDEIKLVRLLNK